MLPGSAADNYLRARRRCIVSLETEERVGAACARGGAAVELDEGHTVIFPDPSLVYMENPYRDRHWQCLSKSLQK
jgi:hypothetical protein